MSDKELRKGLTHLGDCLLWAPILSVWVFKSDFNIIVWKQDFGAWPDRIDWFESLGNLTVIVLPLLLVLTVSDTIRQENKTKE